MIEKAIKEYLRKILEDQKSFLIATFKECARIQLKALIKKSIQEKLRVAVDLKKKEMKEEEEKS